MLTATIEASYRTAYSELQLLFYEHYIHWSIFSGTIAWNVIIHQDRSGRRVI